MAETGSLMRLSVWTPVFTRPIPSECQNNGNTITSLSTVAKTGVLMRLTYISNKKCSIKNSFDILIGIFADTAVSDGEDALRNMTLKILERSLAPPLMDNLKQIKNSMAQNK